MVRATWHVCLLLEFCFADAAEWLGVPCSPAQGQEASWGEGLHGHLQWALCTLAPATWPKPHWQQSSLEASGTGQSINPHVPWPP